MGMTLFRLFVICFAVKGLGGAFAGFLSPPVVGAMVAVMSFIVFLTYRTPAVAEEKNARGGGVRAAFLVAFVGLLAAALFVRARAIAELPIDIRRADMLPWILDQIRDFLAGRNPYHFVDVPGLGLLPRSYLPPLWGSYLPFYVAGVDVRWLNVIAHGIIYLLLADCFLRKSARPAVGSAVCFLVAIGVHAFSRETIAEVTDVQTGPFWLSYAGLLWAFTRRYDRLAAVLAAVVVLCRQPALLLVAPCVVYLFRFERARLYRILPWSLGVGSAIALPFVVRYGSDMLAAVTFHASLIRATSVEQMLSRYGLVGWLARADALWLQMPLQALGLVIACVLAALPRGRDALGALALGGVAYVGFMLFVPTTYAYVWAEPILLLYFLMNAPPVPSEAPVAAEEGVRPYAILAPTTLGRRLVWAARLGADLQLASVWRALRPILRSSRGTVVDIGCGDMPFRHLLPEGQVEYVGLDVPEAAAFGYGKAGAVRFDGTHVPLESESADLVLCTEVLEHHAEPQTLIDEMHRVLEKGGKLALTVPWSARVHFSPNDFFRYTPHQLQRMFTKFSEIQITPRGNDIAVICNKMIVLTLRNLKRASTLHLPSIAALIVLVPLCPFFVVLGNVALTGFIGSTDDPLGYTVVATK